MSPEFTELSLIKVETIESKVTGHETGLDVPTPPPEEVASYTVRTMLRTVPAAVPGIRLSLFLISFGTSHTFVPSKPDMERANHQ